MTTPPLNIPTPQEARLFEAPPADTSLRLYRRLGHVSNLGASGSQFNIYRHPKNGFILRMQNDSGEHEHLAHIPGGHLHTFHDVYERIMGYFTDMLIPSSTMGGRYMQEVVFDTTPGEARRYISILTVKNATVEETQDQHASDLLNGIALPPPPLGRLFHFFTPEGQNAVERKAGPLYELLVETVFEMNSDCFESKDAVQLHLRRMLWPPKSLENWFVDFPYIPHTATHLRLDPEGDWIEVFESDPERYLQISAARVSGKRAFVEQFGDLEHLRHLKEEFVAGGEGTSAQFDEMLRSMMEKAEMELLQSQKNTQ